MEISAMGERFVRIDNRVLPAINVQVDGYPKHTTFPNGASGTFPIYFEIPFEDGGLWIVEDFKDDGGIMVEDHSNWYDLEKSMASVVWAKCWEEFLEMYDRRRDCCSV